MRKFEIVEDFAIKYNEKDIVLPKRATTHSAGYDFYSPTDITIEAGKSEIIWSNVKAMCNEGEFLLIVVTSGMGKRGLILSNGIGVVDKDYYGNPTTDGNIGFRITNLGSEPYTFAKGDKIGQGIFMPYYTLDEDNYDDIKRVGGFGSTDNK